MQMLQVWTVQLRSKEGEGGKKNKNKLHHINSSMF